MFSLYLCINIRWVSREVLKTFNTFLGTQRMSMHEKTRLIPIIIPETCEMEIYCKSSLVIHYLCSRYMIMFKMCLSSQSFDFMGKTVTGDYGSFEAPLSSFLVAYPESESAIIHQGMWLGEISL